MKKIKCKTINLFTKFDVSIFDNHKQWNKARDLYNEGTSKVEKWHLGRALMYYNEGNLNLSLFINKKRYDIGTAIHESTHIVDYLMEEIGIDDIEFRAYLIEDLSIKVMECFK